MYRERFARQCSRKKNLEDIFQRFLITSDPIITNLGPSKPNLKKDIPEEVRQLLYVNEENLTPNDDSDTEDDDDDFED